MRKISAGLLMYRVLDNCLQLLLAHPGGPYFTNRDDGIWTIPKGVVEPNEELLCAAKREFQEEVGIVPTGQFTTLTPVKQAGGKTVFAWAFEGDCDPTACVSNTFTIEWPPHSGQLREFPEVDRVDFFDAAVARRKIVPAQMALIDEIEAILQRKTGSNLK